VNLSVATANEGPRVPDLLQEPHGRSATCGQHADRGRDTALGLDRRRRDRAWLLKPSTDRRDRRIELGVRLLLPLLLLAMSAAAAGAAGGPARPVVAGELRLPAANAFGEPGFHRVLVASARVPLGLRSPTGFRLVLTLRDATRPRQRCSSDHPLSGCATVDWADDPSRPNVPRSGVFQNSVTVRLVSGAQTFFLHPSGGLSSRPEPYQPG